MASTSCITLQTLGKVVQRAPAIDAKTWCSYVVYRPISTRFSAFFSEQTALSEALHTSDFG